MSTVIDRVPIYGEIGALQTYFIDVDDKRADLAVKSCAPYRRFAVKVTDDGLDSFGLREGNYAIFREARWPDRECQIVLVSFGDEVTIRLFEGVTATRVALRVSGDRIEPLELEPTEFTVLGILDGVIFKEFATLLPQEPEEFDWGC